jgi:hypothetical protein
MAELNNDTRRAVIERVIIEQKALQYSLQVQHNAYAPLKSERAKQVLSSLEAQLVEAQEVLSGLEAQLAALGEAGLDK